MAILVKIPDGDRAAARDAARTAGLSLQEFTRRAIVDATSAINGRGGSNLNDLVRQIHRAVCASVDTGGEAGAAVQMLVQLGISPGAAKQKVAAITAAEPRLTAEDIVRTALTIKDAS